MITYLFNKVKINEYNLSLKINNKEACNILQLVLKSLGSYIKLIITETNHSQFLRDLGSLRLVGANAFKEAGENSRIL